jgi:hypothetical protein
MNIVSINEEDIFAYTAYTQWHVTQHVACATSSHDHPKKSAFSKCDTFLLLKIQNYWSKKLFFLEGYCDKNVYKCLRPTTVLRGPQ